MVNDSWAYIDRIKRKIDIYWVMIGACHFVAFVVLVFLIWVMIYCLEQVF